ncbi:MAG: Transcriptional regulator, partial [uncultured Sphingomonadaceae bacterium]
CAGSRPSPRSRPSSKRPAWARSRRPPKRSPSPRPRSAAAFSR